MTLLFAAGIGTVILPLAMGASVLRQLFVTQHTLVYATAGLIMLEASRRAYARVRPGGLAQAVLAGRPSLTPSPAARDHAPAHHARHRPAHLHPAHPMGAARKQP